MTSPIETNNVMERLRDYIYDCTKDEFGHGWTLSAEQTRHVIALADQSLSDRIDVLEGALEPFANLADANMNDPLSKWLAVAHIQNAASLTQGGKNG